MKFNTIPDVLNRAKISRATLYRLWGAGEGPEFFVHLGRRKVTEEALCVWLARISGEAVQ